ncbi:FtsK/SpoIIIE domain-containing protein [Streptomyces noursei]|uniref:FtsK/SpoIIIE domain-containing protein n=1 Tax=Streptomyces noursei TaxID=1971 RepID=UPI0038053989
MQIRLTVLGPRSGPTTRACDVLVTAPAGTALATVAGSLAAAVAGTGADVGTTGSSAPVILYAGTERLDPQRAALGEPPLIDGAVLSLQGPGPAPAHGLPHGSARLRVVSGPDAGGVHLLHGGQIRIGRSADADVPLDDPDVSRLHCAVTVEPDGAVYVADLRSTNGTAVDGTELGDRAVLLPPGALLRIGESALRLQSPPRTPDPALNATPDGEGHLRVAPGQLGPGATATGATTSGALYAGPGHSSTPATTGTGRRDTPLRGIPAPTSRAAHDTDVPPGPPGSPAPAPSGPVGGGLFPPAAPHQQTAPGPAAHASAAPDPTAPGAVPPPHAPHAPTHTTYGTGPTHPAAAYGTSPAPTSGHGGAPMDGQTHGGQQSLVPVDPMARKAGRRGGIGAWARRLAGGRPVVDPDAPEPGTPYDDGPAPAGEPARSTAVAAPTATDTGTATGPADPERWPDAAAVLLTVLGPGPRLWERGPDHPDALTVRLGTAERDGGRTVAPVTVDLRRAGALGLAGPRGRLVGLARSVTAQLAALHSPGTLEIVLLGTDRAQAAEERVADWSWLGWLPHVRPTRGQDCRLLLAFDKEQATARTSELVRRLDDGPLGPGWPSADRAEVASAAARHLGPHTLLIVDGDPGSSALRETTARLAAGGPAAGIHVLCLAETPAASPAFPLAATYEAARVASPAFGECGAVAVLSGDVATALRVVQPGSGPNGAVATVDAVSAAWAERFARSLAPLRETETGAGAGGPTAPRAAVPLPDATRLLDELGLARATPASLLARWAAAQDTDRPSAAAVLGAGPHGPVVADLAADGAHLLVEGAPATGKTELLRSLAASLAAADRPDRLSLVLVDGAGTERGDGLRACTELPHVTTHLAASDPVRMREFAQALSSELKRRAEILAGTPFSEWRTKHLPAPRIVAPRRSAESTATHGAATANAPAPHTANATGSNPSGPSNTTGIAGTASTSATTSASGARPATASASAAAPHQHATSTPPISFTPSNESSEQFTLRNRCRNEEEAGGTTAGPADPSRTGTLRLRTRTEAPEPGPAASQAPAQGPAHTSAPMPRLFILVDDFDALVSPALGSTGRPAAGSVVRALEAVARDGVALGVHLIAATGHPDRTEGTTTAERAALRIQLGRIPSAAGRAGPAEPAPSDAEPVPPGRGWLYRAEDGASTPFQAGRVTGRIPRTSTLRPTVVPLEWQRMGDPPARRPLRELGNGPTDLALLASALQRAAQSSGAPAGPSLM